MAQPSLFRYLLERRGTKREMMEIFDTHTHLNVENFAGQEAQEIALARELGVTSC